MTAARAAVADRTPPRTYTMRGGLT